MQADPQVVDEIYEAAALPEKWPDVLGKLSHEAGAWGGGLLVFDRQQRMRFTATSNYMAVFESFAAHGDNGRYDNKRPKRALASGYAGFQHDLEMFTQDELDTDPVYRDFIYPHGIRWTGGTIVPVPTSDILAFDFSRRREPFERSDMERLDAIARIWLGPLCCRIAWVSRRRAPRPRRSAPLVCPQR